MRGIGGRGGARRGGGEQGGQSPLLQSEGSAGTLAWMCAASASSF